MKLTKENIYIDLRGKSKEELTDLHNFLISVGEKLFRDNLNWFLKYPNLEGEYAHLSYECGDDIWMNRISKNKQEVTIEQLKEILKLTEMTRNQELREEAKKRGYTHDNFKCLHDLKHTSNPNLDKWHYEGWTDILFTNSCGNGGKVVYKEGVWAEMIKPVEEFTPVALERQLEKTQEALALENIQVDCSELTKEQVKEMADVFVSNGYKRYHDTLETTLLVKNQFKFIKEYCGYYTVGMNSLEKTTITYDKFMELFGNKEKELLNNKTMVDLMGYSVLVDNEEQARKLQETAFEQGFKWRSGMKEILYLDEKFFEFGYAGKKVISCNPSGNHYQDKFITKKAHFNDLFKEETLQQKEQRLLKELEEVRKEIEDSKIKVGDWIKFNNRINKGIDKVISIDDSVPYCIKTQFGYYKRSECIKITNPELIKLLEQEMN